MANFQKHGKNVHGQTLKVPSGSSYELGLWGPVDTRNNKELIVSVSPDNPAISVRPGSMLKGQPVRVWTVSNLPAGKTLLVAKDLGGLVWTQVTLDVGGGAPGTVPAHKYTDHPNEVLTKTTTPSPKQVIDALMAAWPGLNETGARVMTAQFMGETGDGKYCFNWNLGNMKAGVKEPHMYLARVWECIGNSKVDGVVKAGDGHARVPDAQEVNERHWVCASGTSVVVFAPPHSATRFAARDSLEAGAAKWVEHHQRKVAATDPSYLTYLNAGDIDAVVNCLVKARYFTAKKEQYISLMKSKKAQIDKKLGPVQK